MMEKVLDDRFIISDEIQKMSKEELKREIARCEAMSAEERRRLAEIEYEKQNK